MTHIIGVDLGQTTDPTAIVIVERTVRYTGEPALRQPSSIERLRVSFGGGDPRRLRPQPVHGTATAYALHHAERLPLGTSYLDVVARTSELVAVLANAAAAGRPNAYAIRFGHLPDRVDGTDGPPVVAVDATGVGRPVVDMFRAARIGASLRPVTITGGSETAWDGDHAKVPKRDLVSNLAKLLQSGQLRWPASLPMASELERELTGFRARISVAGRDSYGAGEDWRSAPHDDLVLALAIAVWIGEFGRGVRASASERGAPRG